MNKKQIKNLFKIKSKSETPKTRKTRLINRILIFILVYVSSIVILIGKMVYILINDNKEYELIVLEALGTKDVVIKPLRGSILDKNHKTLASSQITYDIILDPKTLLQELSKDARMYTITNLAKFFNKPEKEILDIINNNPNTHYRVFEKHISIDQRDELLKLNLSGVAYIQSFSRTYPKGDFASALIGYYNNETGRFGVEQFYNKQLKGEEGRIFTSITSGELFTKKNMPVINGASLVLTLDEVIQQTVEQVMDDYVKKAKPVAASAIIMNPNTGAIYSMYSYPSFNPNTYGNLTQELGATTWDSMSPEQKAIALYTAWENYNIYNRYEPGSTFKPLMVAAAIDMGYLDPENFRANCTGSIKVDGVIVKCWYGPGHGIQTVEQVLANSCNPGVIEIAEMVPNDVFHKYMLEFGLLEKTGIDLAGEQVGIIHSLEGFGPIQKATSSMGQTFMLTPIQLLTGFASVINGGYLIEPYVVSHIIDESQSIIYSKIPKIKRQVISSETSKILAQYLEAVVLTGTGGFAAVPGYRIGGKTGTAEKGYPRDGSTEILSFVGYTPIDKPEIIALVLIDEVEDDEIGGTGLAFSKIMTEILPYMEIFADNKKPAPVNLVKVPNIKNLDIYDAINKINALELDIITKGGGNIVSEQYPAAETLLPKSANVTLYLETKKPHNLVIVPNVIDLPVEEARKLLGNLLTLEGPLTGNILTQIPPEGTLIEKNSKIIVQTTN
ncbi:hypothetical protein AN641_00605 [Candidatus Epulonipiscioides gigas]|nr:hypothetical protein AN641_00605 [Epulopiscium sp. SCG-C07WGA-EpuloA2]